MKFLDVSVAPAVPAIIAGIGETPSLLAVDAT